MRYGRRRVMIGGSLLAGVAGFLCATVDSLPTLLAFRGLAGIGEAALFVGAATLVADLAPPHRRAEAASYFSVAVFGGLGVGPIIGEAVLGDDRFHLAFLVAAAFTVLAAVLSLAVPHSVEPADGRRRSSNRPRHLLSAGSAASSTPPPSGPGSCWRPASPRSRRSRRSFPTTPGRSASAARAPCSPPTAWSASCCASSAPACPSGSVPGASVTIAFVALAAALGGLAAFPEAWALWSAAVVIGVGMAFMYPSLMALTVNRVDDRERPVAISSFTMFFEIGTVTGGLLLGLTAQLLGKRASFAAAVVVCAFGLWLLRARVTAPDVRATVAAPSIGPALVPAACD